MVQNENQKDYKEIDKTLMESVMDQALKPKAIIIGSADVIKLCVIRAVGEFGCDVDVIHYVEKHRLTPIDHYSMYVNNYYYVDKSKDGALERFLLERCVDSYQKPVIITLDDYSTYIIDNARNKLEEHFLFAHLSNGKGLAGLMDKHVQKTLAEDSGLNVVKGWPIVFENGNFVIPNDIEYPCFVKGLYSYIVSKEIQKKCDSETDLRSFLEQCKKTYPYSIYAEEFIEIDKEFGVIGVCNDEKKYVIPAQAELMVMGKGSKHGVSMLGQVTPLDPNSELYNGIEKLLSKLNYVGLFNIDFVESKGRMMFVELNFRFAAYGYGVYKAGVNLPAIFIDAVTQRNSQLQTQFNGRYYYLNEKIAFINVIEGAIKWDEYKKMKQKADFLMVTDSMDPKPIKRFRKDYFLRYLSFRLKNSIKKLH